MCRLSAILTCPKALLGTIKENCKWIREIKSHFIGFIKMVKDTGLCFSKQDQLQLLFGTCLMSLCTWTGKCTHFVNVKLAISFENDMKK